MDTPVATKLVFSPYQKLVVAILAFLQFTIVLDFMIMSPLGAIMMPDLQITPAQFGLVVSIYAFSAGVSGFLAAGFADRFDRKKLLMFFYTGFILGTLFCALAPNYHFMLGARMMTGLFGGVIGSIVMAIATDLFAMEQRGRVIGFIQTAFAASQILGIPAGLFLANKWNWHAAFFMIVICGTLAGVVIMLRLQPINAHLKLQTENNALKHLWETMKNPQYFLPFSAMATMSIGGFMLMPFGSLFSVHNLGVSMRDLPLVYLVTGIAAIFMGPLIGKASDAYGKLKVFLFGAALTIVMVVIYTNMGISPLWWVIVVNVVMFCAIFSRIIPSQAMMSAIPTPKNRGAFMAVTSSLQQVSGGVASLIAGLIVVTAPSGKLEHFDTLGYILVGTVLLSMFMMFKINQTIAAKSS